MRDPASLVTVYSTSTDAPGDFLGLSYPNYLDFRQGNPVFSALLTFRPFVARISGRERADLINGEMVSGDFFDVLGVRPILGRTFTADEDATPNTHPVAVLGYAVWKQRFSGDPAVVGRTIRLNGLPFTVIGVAPEGFHGLVMLGAPDLWVPVMMHDRVLFGRIADWFHDRDGLVLNAVGRLKPGVSIRQAEAAMRTMAAGLERAYPVENKGIGITLMPLSQATIHYSIRGTVVLASEVLMFLVGMLLLITTANVANLLLARALERRREIAVRLSIGASRGQLAQQLIAEGLVLSLAGGLVGLLFSRWLATLLWSLRPPTVPASLTATLDARVLGFALLLCLATGLFFGLVPILQVLRFELVPALKDRPSGSPGRSRWLGLRHLLVVTQVALSFVSLVGAGLFLRSLHNAQQIDPGFETRKIALVSFDLGPQGYSERRGREFQRQLVDLAQGLPGVRSAALAERTMFDFHGHTRVGVTIEGREQAATKEGSMIRINLVGAGYFQTLGMKLRSGRDFTPLDREGAPRVAVINAAMADRFWPGRSPLHQRFRFEDEKEGIEVVGVAETSHFDYLDQRDEPYIYVPLLQRYTPEVTLHLRTYGDPAVVLPGVRRTIRSLDRDLALTAERTVPEMIAQSLWGPRTTASLLSCFSLLALILSATGVYSTTAFSLRSRFREIGIRQALGAQRSDLFKLVLFEGGALVLAGLSIGVLVTVVAMPHVAGILSGLGGSVLIFAGAGLVLAMVALVANLFPTREAIGSDVIRALRQD